MLTVLGYTTGGAALLWGVWFIGEWARYITSGQRDMDTRLNKFAKR